ncbi:hypothetical protein Ddye_006452 [Dipteronia dyeriana]|uniref:Tesmin/TSO1-like CXC domain-containing protein n=1 Tax=Dipteronia dyeriana TaxID=168575 RepID=A0AAE0CQP3_9ROSI|nr:hypothetical protein Ddye_006452 [Dipteronia dyeriana]
MKKQNRRSKQKDVADSSPSAHCEERVIELQHENDTLKREIEELRYKLADVSSTPDAGTEKLKETHLQKMKALEEQVMDLKKKLEVKSQFSTQKPKSDDAARHFQDEVQRLKAQKVQLQCKLKLDSVRFRVRKSSLQKEILQLKKEKRRNEFEMHLLLALNQKQKLVLQRKAKETFMATERLKALLESRKALACRKAGTKKGHHTKYQSIEHELDVTVRVQEVCSEYECQMEEMADVIEKLKLEAEMLREENSRCLLEDDEVGWTVKDSELRDLKEEVARLGSLVSHIAKPKMEEINQKKLLQDQADLVQSSVSTGSNAGSNTNMSEADSSTLEDSEGFIDAIKKVVSGVCCSCSKKSLCKTSKCGCRAAGGSCGTACGCAVSKCTNREIVPIKLDDALQSSDLVSQDAMLQKTLIEKPREMKEDHCPKKQPLRDIGNVLVKSISLKPGLRKRGKKPTTQQDNADSCSSQSENTNSPGKARN